MTTPPQIAMISTAPGTGLPKILSMTSAVVSSIMKVRKMPATSCINSLIFNTPSRNRFMNLPSPPLPAQALPGPAISFLCPYQLSRQTFWVEMSLMQNHSSVYNNSLAGNEITVLRGKKHHGPEKILGQLIPFKAPGCSHGPERFFGIHRVSVDGFANRKSWSNGVDTNSIIPQLPCQGPRQSNDPSL